MTLVRPIVALLLLFALALPARAEVGELRVAKQYGLGYVQYMIMEDQKLTEKHAKAAGLGDVTVEWSTFRSSDVMNDALLSGSVHFVSLGVPGLMTIWDRTKGSIDVRGASGLNALPLALMAIMYSPPPMGLKWSVAIVRDTEDKSMGAFGLGNKVHGAVR